MKPLKLTMSAFVSYADRRVIDFAALGAGGLYLITGETGSGKTAIFDAISFALFGRASGSARDDYKILRSDFAGEKDKTYVELDFLCGERRYYIKRAIRKTGQEAELRLPDGETLSGDRCIKPKMAEILGLDRDQFAQIVMIAQNDFLRFLQSGTEDRLKILRRIFGTGAFKQLQERLKIAVKRESEKYESVKYAFERHNADIYGREKQFGEWAAQMEADRAELAAADQKLAEYDALKQKLAADSALASDLSGKIDELAAWRAALERQAARAEEMAALKELVGRGETALRIKPPAAAARDAAAAAAAAAAALAEAGELAAEAAAELEAADKVIAGCPPLAGSGAAGSGAADLLRLWESSAEKLKKFEKLEAGYGEITEKMAGLAGLRLEYEALTGELAAADSQYEAIDRAFMAAQAGLLAQTLAAGAPCPVCGSTGHPAPAELPARAATEEARRRALKAAAAARDRRDAKARACGSLASAIETLKERFLRDFSEPADTKWAEAEAALPELLAKTRQEEAELNARKNAEQKALAELTARREIAEARKTKAAAAAVSAATLVAERTGQVLKTAETKAATGAAFREALLKSGFTDEKYFAAALISENELAAGRRRLSDHEQDGERLARDIKRLEMEIAGRARPAMESLKSSLEAASMAAKNISEKRDEIKSRLDKTGAALKELRRAAADFEKIEKTYAAVKQLSDTANGKLDFETYAQTAYFDQVLRAANLRLRLMSQNRYALRRQAGGGDRRSRTGLEIEALDGYTGKARPADSLSGGESFMASLALALGLSDVVQRNAGGVRLDAMFIDEGFGSLDAEVLDLAVGTLSAMAGAGRMIGVISHVAELRERIDRQLRVEKTNAGSRISLAL